MNARPLETFSFDAFASHHKACAVPSEIWQVFWTSPIESGPDLMCCAVSRLNFVGHKCRLSFPTGIDEP
ncbi:hypothetical protein AKJ29_12185 [Aliiroseovarius crassostreae]|uniref:Uncharacterized protein n=1 Tax=Aliiroseovarius crassostreae TaxID=154981 RepID=A0A0P7IHL1_9RHOB|nr:hypothetical protein AKJ29_12185 [Aliiroseovarius crassostreae]